MQIVTFIVFCKFTLDLPVIGEWGTDILGHDIINMDVVIKFWQLIKLKLSFDNMYRLYRQCIEYLLAIERKVKKCMLQVISIK